MKYITFPNIPQVPEHMLEPVSDIIAKPSWNGDDMNPNHLVRLKKLPNVLEEWCKSLFPNDQVFASYQLTLAGFNKIIHYDQCSRTDLRTHTFHYMLDQGGDEVYTKIYHKKPGVILNDVGSVPNDKAPYLLDVIDCAIVPIKKWVRFPVDIYHSVEGILPGRYRTSVVFNVLGQPGAYSPDIA